MPEHPNKNPPMPEFYYDPDKNSGNVLLYNIYITV